MFEHARDCVANRFRFISGQDATITVSERPISIRHVRKQYDDIVTQVMINIDTIIAVGVGHDSISRVMLTITWHGGLVDHLDRADAVLKCIAWFVVRRINKGMTRQRSFAVLATEITEDTEKLTRALCSR